MKAQRKARKLEAKKNYLKGIKDILTPEQYVVFLENVYINTPDLGKAKEPKRAKLMNKKGSKKHSFALNDKKGDRKDPNNK